MLKNNFFSLLIVAGLCLVPTKQSEAQSHRRRTTVRAVNPVFYGPPDRSVIPGRVPGWWCFRTPSNYSHCERDITFCRHIGSGLGVPGFSYDSCRYKYNAYCFTYFRSDNRMAYQCSESIGHCLQSREDSIDSGLSTQVSFCNRFR